MEDFKGAGAVVIHLYHPYHPNNPAVILFRSKKGVYGDGGGIPEKTGEHPTETASRELTEESQGLLRIDINRAHRNGHVCLHKHKYIAFVIPVSACDVRRSMYHHNLSIAKQHKNSLPHHWKETDDMSHFFVSDLINAGLLSSTSGHLKGVRDVYGNVATIDSRAKAILRKGYLAGLLCIGPQINKLRIDTTNGIGDKGMKVNSVTKSLVMSLSLS